MNLRHAAALALVGWYLMVPPFVAQNSRFPNDGRLANPKAPLSQWQKMGLYDSAEDCRKDHRDLQSVLDSANPQTDDYRGQMEAGQCISTDDPCLKEK